MKIIYNHEFNRLCEVFDDKRKKYIVGYKYPIGVMDNHKCIDIAEAGTYDIVDYLKRHGLLNGISMMEIDYFEYTTSSIILEGMYGNLLTAWHIEIMCVDDKEDALRHQIDSTGKITSQLLRIILSNHATADGVLTDKYGIKVKR